MKYTSFFEQKRLEIVFLCLAVCWVIGMFFLSTDTKSKVPSQTNVDLTLSQYSDRRIIARAITSTSGLYANRSAASPTVPQEGCGVIVNYSTDNSAPLVGQQVNYHMDIENRGTETCNNPSVSVYYSHSENYISSSPPPTASNYYWQFPSLKPFQSYDISFTTIGNDLVQEADSDTQACATADNAVADACITFKNTDTQTHNSSTVQGIASVPLGISSDTSQLSPADRDSIKEYGSWVWVSPKDMSASYQQKIIQTAKQNGMNVLYVTIDTYLDIDALPEGSEKDEQKKAYSDALENFITLANMNGIAVDAEAGWRNWAEADNISKAFAIVEYVKIFNKTHTQRLRGFQYDVEPYLLPSYQKNKEELLKNFLTLIDATVTRLQSSSLQLTVVIPHFYDDAQEWTPEIEYGGGNTYTFNHLLSILEKRPGSSLIIMAYRNSTEGDDSSIALSRTEITEAQNDAPHTSIIVAQETGNVQPAYVTFYHTSRAYYTSQISDIIHAFNGYRSFGGIAVHYIDPFMELR